jgi:hypothetical protein
MPKQPPVWRRLLPVAVLIFSPGIPATVFMPVARRAARYRNRSAVRLGHGHRKCDKRQLPSPAGTANFQRSVLVVVVVFILMVHIDAFIAADADVVMVPVRRPADG